MTTTAIAPPEMWLKAMALMRDEMIDKAEAVRRGEWRRGLSPEERAAYLTDLDKTIADATATIDQAIADRDAGRPYGPKRRP
mgnify:FL=1